MQINGISVAQPYNRVAGSIRRTNQNFKGAYVPGMAEKALSTATATAGASSGGIIAGLLALFGLAKLQNDALTSDMSPKEMENYIDMRIMMDNTLG